MSSFIFSDEVVERAREVMAPITEEATKRTRESLARGETPDLVGALTASDVAKWIQNAKRTKGGRKL